MQLPGRPLLAAAFLIPASIAAQASDPVGQLPINYQVRATLTGASTTFRNAPAHYWVVNCPPGTTFQLDLIAVWDAYALVTTEHGTVLAEDDNTRGEPNARFTYSCPGGLYRVIVTTRVASRTVGDYKLVLRAVETPASFDARPVPLGMPEPLVMTAPSAVASASGGAPQPTSPPASSFGPPAASFSPAPFNSRTTSALGRITNYDVKTATLGPRASSYYNRLFDPWTWQCEPVREVTFTLKSAVADQLIVLDARGRELARADNNTDPQSTKLVFQCMETQPITVGVMSRSNASGEYTLTAQARIYTPPLGAIPVPRTGGGSGGFCPNASRPVCADPQSGLRWGRAAQGAIPPSAYTAGSIPRGAATQPIAVCRAYFQLANARPGDWQVLPGKITQGLAGCYVGVNGDEVIATAYEVLVRESPAPPGDPLGDARLVAASGGAVPANAIPAGMGTSPQFVCVALMPNDGAHPGRIAANGQGCSVAWAGKEVVAKEYQVLVRP
jgi:hypothetical protein